LEAIPKEKRDELTSYELNTVLNQHLYFLDLKQIIIKYWDSFEKIFKDKLKFESFADCINKYRIDAHAKSISEEDFALLTWAFNWYDENLIEIS